MEIDEMKRVIRRNLVADGSRRENDAEHSWHFAVAAMVFAEYAQSAQVDISRAIRLALVHDLVEVYAGDTFAYDKEGYETKNQRERDAADKLFSILPEEQGREIRALWEEFEDMETETSMYANSIDRIMPLLLNYRTEGYTWRLRDDINSESVYARMAPIKEGMPPLWEAVCELVEDSVKKGYLKR